MAAARGAVGFFDSGLGGLCILDAFRKLCPHESTVYIADSKNCPYGNKPAAEIARLAEANTRRLLRRGCKMVVVACNTATAAAIDGLRERHPEVPFIGIEPAVKPAALRSKTGVVGVLATAGTFGGRLYNETKAKFAKDVTVIATVADEFVEIVEKNCLASSGRDEASSGRDEASSGRDEASSGRDEASSGRDEASSGRDERPRSSDWLDSPSVVAVVRAKVEPLLAAGCDKIVLGCTHFPHLRPVIESVCAGRAEVIDPSDAVARQARRVLAARALLAPPDASTGHVFIRT